MIDNFDWWVIYLVVNGLFINMFLEASNDVLKTEIGYLLGNDKLPWYHIKGTPFYILMCVALFSLIYTFNEAWLTL